LDTFHVNGHTTASDALRVGLPVLTKPGRQLASRVASSLLSFVGLPELICESESEYIEKAVGFALDRSKAWELQDKLKSNILTSDLFQPSRFARNLEAAYIAVYENELGLHDPDVLA
jgi:protein O-GlcNAc transferase